MFWQDQVYLYIFEDRRSLLLKRKRDFCTRSKTFEKILKCRLIVPSYDKNIIWDSDSPGEEPKKTSSLLFIAPKLISGSSIIKIPLVEFEIDGTFYIPHYGRD
jgi:hypothetical protein